MATESSGAHTGYWTISGGVLTIRTVRGKTITRGEGCDRWALTWGNLHPVKCRKCNTDSG
jgi:hypothetical protein